MRVKLGAEIRMLVAEATVWEIPAVTLVALRGFQEGFSSKFRIAWVRIRSVLRCTQMTMGTDVYVETYDSVGK